MKNPFVPYPDFCPLPHLCTQRLSHIPAAASHFLPRLMTGGVGGPVMNNPKPLSFMLAFRAGPLCKGFEQKGSVDATQKMLLALGWLVWLDG